MTKPTKIRLLIADDSSFVRQALIRVLSDHEEIDIVGEARDGLNAIEMARQLLPDVMTLDLQMPHLNGLDVLRVLRDEVPTRIIMVSSFTRAGADETFRALEEGAFDFVDKTLVRNRGDFIRLGDELLEKIKLVAAQPSLLGKFSAAPPIPKSKSHEVGDHFESLDADKAQAQALVVVGASTGGPPAVRRFFSLMKPTIPAVFIVVQHMPPGFSSGFARRLNQISPLLVSEVLDGELLLPRHAYVVPSGSEIAFAQTTTGVRAILRSGESDLRHRPSLDFTLKSASALEFPLKIAIVLTGMGADGKEGIRDFVAGGGRVGVQDQDSCIIYGMPRAVKEATPPEIEGTPEQLGQFVAAAVAAVGDS